MTNQIYGVLGNGIIQNNALLTVFLQHYANQCSSKKPCAIDIQRLSPNLLLSNKKNVTLLGWGRKRSYYRAKTFAQKYHLPIITLEDGFLRSLDTGQHSRFACSMVIDPIGIYFDSHEPSYLEQLIVENQLTNQQKNRAVTLIQQIIDEQLSKYNTTTKTGTVHTFDFNKTKKNILLIDQVAGDQSIIGASANANTFKKMLQTACANHVDATIWIKAHPASDKGYLTALKLPKNCQIIRTTVNPIELLKQVDDVYTVSSHMGFEALMLGKKVHCFGLSWYSGWGLTDDSHIDKAQYDIVWQRRGAKKQATLDELFDACYIQYSYYANPATGKICQIEQVIQWLVTNRQWRDKLPNNITVFEFSKWKYVFVRKFLSSSQATLFFKPKLNVQTIFSVKCVKFPKNAPFLVWGFAKKQVVIKNLATYQPHVWCMEDGFIRSNGLGANLILPLSVVLDQTGIYYNALQISDLERLLQAKLPLTSTEQQRVQQLIQRLLKQKVSKYNVGMTEKLSIDTHKIKILVVGQVEDDMSVRLCGSDIKDNLTLLQTVRNSNPQAYIIYKPHPDVQAGLRMGKIDDEKMYQLSDKVLIDTNITDCLDVVDEVHTISSLTGFEALLRGLTVVCYGLPFYAGFGLTIDKADNYQASLAKQRRYREQPLTLEQLVYTTLIDYPLYRIPHGYGLAQVENVIDYLYKSEQSTLPKPNKTVYKSLKLLVKKQLKPKIAKKLMQGRRKVQEVSQHLFKK